MNQSALIPGVNERRTCRCCGRSIMFEERKEVDSFKQGLDVCPDCLLHFNRRSCLYDDVPVEVNRREIMAGIWDEPNYSS